jgi:hypothetical protein
VAAPQREPKASKNIACLACGSRKIIPATNPQATGITDLKGGRRFALFTVLLKILIVVFALLVLWCLYALKQQITPP